MAKQLFIEKCDCALSLGKMALQEAATLDITENEIILRNVPLTILDRKNQNGRRYMTEDMRKALKDAEYDIKNRSLLGQSDEHPEGTFVAPSHASHTILNAYIKENVEVFVEGKTEHWNMLFADVLILDTDEGRNLLGLVKANCSIGTSIRSLGDMDGDKVVNIEWKGYDHVSLPSSGTNLFMPIKESVSVKAESRRGIKESNGEDMKELYVIAVSDTTNGDNISLGFVKDKDAPLDSMFTDDVNEAFRFTDKSSATSFISDLDATYTYSVEEIIFDTDTDGYKVKITEISDITNVNAYNIEWNAPETVSEEWLGNEVMLDFLVDELMGEGIDENSRCEKIRAKIIEKTGYSPAKFDYRIGVKEDETGTLSQDDKSVTISLGNGTEITKTYDTKYQANVAHAGIASGKIGGDELLKETKMKESFEVSTSTETTVQTDETALNKAAEILSPESPATAVEVSIEKDPEDGTITVSSETEDTVDTLQQALTMVGQANAQPNTVVTSSNIEPIEEEEISEMKDESAENRATKTTLNKNSSVKNEVAMNKKESAEMVLNGSVVTNSPEAKGMPEINNGTPAEKELNKAVNNAITAKPNKDGEMIKNVNDMIGQNVAARNKAADDVINVSNRTYEENAAVNSELLKQLAKAEALLKSKARRVVEMKKLATAALKEQKARLDKASKAEKERMIDTVATKIESIVDGCEKIERDLENEACRAKKSLKMAESFTRSAMKLNKIMIEHILSQKTQRFTVKESADRKLARKFA